MVSEQEKRRRLIRLIKWQQSHKKRITEGKLYTYCRVSLKEAQTLLRSLGFALTESGLMHNKFGMPIKIYRVEKTEHRDEMDTDKNPCGNELTLCSHGQRCYLAARCPAALRDNQRLSYPRRLSDVVYTNAVKMEA